MGKRGIYHFLRVEEAQLVVGQALNNGFFSMLFAFKHKTRSRRSR